jgi:hypothetical protein
MVIQARSKSWFQSFNDFSLSRRQGAKQVLGVRVSMIFVFYFLNAASSLAQVADKQESVVYEQTLFVELKQNVQDSDGFSAIIKTKPIMIATKNRFILKIHNPGTRPLEFDEAGVGCNCLKVQFAANIIAPGETVEAVIEYASQRQNTEDFVINVLFMRAGEVKGSLSLTGGLEGLLVIQGASLLESNGVFSTWRIPILATPPIEIARLVLTMPSQLRDLEGRIEIEKGKPVIVVSGPEKSLGTEGTEGIAGEILVEDPVLGIKASAQVTFVQRPKIRISPKIAFFSKPDKSRDSKEVENRFEADFLVQAVASLPETEVEHQTMPINVIRDIKCQAELGKLTYKSTKINDSLYRVKVCISSKRDLPTECDLKWKIQTDDGIYSVSALALFPKE